MTSTKTFLWTFIASGLFANLSAFIFFPESSIIGASGAAMGVLAALAVYRPRKIGLALGVPLPMWAVLVAYVFINLVGLPAASNVAYEAHMFGLVIGTVIGYRLREKPYTRKIDSGEESEQDNWRERIREWEEKWMV